jgi:hypothetical protein
LAETKNGRLSHPEPPAAGAGKLPPPPAIGWSDKSHGRGDQTNYLPKNNPEFFRKWLKFFWFCCVPALEQNFQPGCKRRSGVWSR